MSAPQAPLRPLQSGSGFGEEPAQQELPLELFPEERLTPEQSEASLVAQLEAPVEPAAHVPPVLVAQAANDDHALDLEGKVARAEGVLMQVLCMGMPVCCSWSAGKDSSTVLNLLLVAAAKLKAAGKVVPPIVVTHSDTAIENPEVHLHARAEMEKVRAFGRRSGLEVTVEVAGPHLSDHWAVRVIGGRALPPFPGTNRDCTTAWKVQPQHRLRKTVLKRLQDHCAAAGVEPVVLIGTRYEESEDRARRMRERGESDVQIRRGTDAKGKPSHLFLSPICFWTADDVWEYLGTVRAGAIHGYSDFEETFRIYADAQGTSCVVVAEEVNRLSKSSKACGARHGCSLCTAVGEDKSMENMLTLERYSYMRGLNQLRNFLSATRWDLGRRSWLGRTINDGYIRIAPDAYSPAMMEELLRYALTIDIRECEEAASLGIPPRFQLVRLEHLIAIDAMWSLQAFHKPFHALKIYDEICNQGRRFPVPALPAYARPKEFPERYLHVGADWEDGYRMAYTGLRSVVHEMAAMESSGCMDTRLLADGRQVMAINTERLLTVDEESAYLVLEMELPRLLAKHDRVGANPTEAYFWYLSFGTLAVRAGQEGEIDEMLRRSNWKVRQGVAGQIDHTLLLARSLSAAEAGRTKMTNGTVRTRGEEGSRSKLFADLTAQVLPHLEAAAPDLEVSADEQAGAMEHPRMRA
jgi:DNA sulfur modification protein DndC